MFEGFETTDIDTDGARIHLRHGGEGPPLLCIGLAHCEGEAFEEYVRCFTKKTIFGSCEDYRACPT
jgi:hypothetical protein